MLPGQLHFYRMKNKSALKKAAAVLFALIVWQLASMAVGYEILLASPLSVLKTLFQIASEKSFWTTVLTTSLRIAAGFALAFVIGLILGILASRFEWVRTLLWPFVLTVKSVPVASFIVLSLIWLTSAKLATFVVFMATLPVVYNNVLQGLASVDPAQKEAAQMLGAGWLRTVRSVMIPGIRPYLLSSASTGCGMAFKAGVAAEVVALVSGSIGEQIYMSKVYFETAGLFAWTLVIILISFVFEKLFTLILNALIKLCCA